LEEIDMGTIRDPQMDVATADYTIGGDWEFNNKMTYTSHPTFSADTDVIDKKYADDLIISGVNQDNIYYVGKHGNDSTGDGLNIEHAFLTLQKGINEADTQSPTVSSQYVVRCEDGGSYDSFTLSAKPYIHVEAQGAQLESSSGTYIFSTNNSIKVDKIIAGGGFASGTLVNYNGSGDGYLTANEISGSAVTTGLYTQGAGTCFADVQYIDVTSLNRAVDVGPDSTLHLTSKHIRGEVYVRADGYSNIITDQMTGDVEAVGTNSYLYIIINGNFNGNITAGDGATIKMLVGSRSSGYTDSIDPGATVDVTYIGEHDILHHKNVLIGGDYIVNPRQEVPTGVIVTVANDTYVADNTIFLGQYSGTIDMSLGTDNNLEATYSGGSAGKWGFIIHVENKDSVPIINHGTASLSFRAAWTAGPRTATLQLKAALLAWDGTADFVVTDPISTWTTSPPTLISNWTYENTPVDLNIDTTGVYETFKIENIAVDTAGAKNLAVLVWSADPANEIGNTLQISNIELNAGPVAEDFAPRSAVEELMVCQRYYNKSYDVATPRGTITHLGCQSANKGAAGTSPWIGMDIRFPHPMFKTPTVTPYSTNSGTAGNIYKEGVGDRPSQSQGESNSGASIRENSPTSGEFFATYHWVADARF
jgi:hypothetical protein